MCCTSILVLRPVGQQHDTGIIILSSSGAELSVVDVVGTGIILVLGPDWLQGEMVRSRRAVAVNQAGIGSSREDSRQGLGARVPVDVPGLDVAAELPATPPESPGPGLGASSHSDLHNSRPLAVSLDWVILGSGVLGLDVLSATEMIRQGSGLRLQVDDVGLGNGVLVVLGGRLGNQAGRQCRSYLGSWISLRNAARSASVSVHLLQLQSHTELSSHLQNISIIFFYKL